jgi:hypothetical protein
MKSPDRTFSVAAGMTTNVTLQHDRGARVDVSAQLPDGAAATSSCFTARPLGIGAPGQIQDTACTGLDASVVLYVGAPATIVISQDSGPSGYVLAPDVHVVTQLDGHSTATLHMTVGGGSIAVEQKSASGERVTGGCYELWQSPTGGVETSYETTCDSEDAAGTDGFVRFTDLQPGRYRVQEVEAPDGYHLSPGDLFAVVGTDEVSLSQAHQPLPELVVNSR